MPRKLFLICLTGTLATPIHSNAESCFLVMDTDGIPTPTLVIEGRPFAIEPAFEDYSYMLQDACDAWGISWEDGCDILPMMGAIQLNAVATICDDNKVIVYDRRLSPRIGYQGAQAVIAHELGHHICNHLDTKVTSPAESNMRELEADRFAGATMRRIGFSREMALGYIPLLMEQPSDTHPGREQREAALVAGWDDPRLITACARD